MQIKIEIRKLSSVYKNGNLMYPGNYVFRWVKLSGMPWMLADMFLLTENCSDDNS